MILPEWGPNTPFILVGVVLVLVLAVARRNSVVRRLVSLATWAVLALLVVVMLSQRAAFDPYLGKIAAAVRLDPQRIAGDETRIRMAPDGHFWARVTIGGVTQRMLVDSGATVTALSTATAAKIGLRPQPTPFPVVLTTANGTVRAQSGAVPELALGNIVARDLAVVVSPAFGDTNVIGMNFLSRLKSWRVEGDTMILVPHHPQAT